ncbi:uncharacterized protein LOC143567180 [Bidens hawaiensis]|uniref:uncharacterized protein LOC143567180 n=1 Tax=Bidens hawaiensis TaxID=980011 RepID=UPI004049434F
MVQDMKKFTACVTSKNMPKMDKHTIIRKNRLKNKKHAAKHPILKKVVAYLLSDSYMYNPLVSSQPWFDLPPPKQLFPSTGIQEGVALPIRGKNKKLIDKVVDYLEADCYLYAPLIDNNHHHHKCCSTGAHDVANDNSGGEMKKGGDELSQQVGVGHVVKKSVAYRETVKRVVH